MAGHRIYGISFAKIYSLYLEKVKRKGKTKKEVNEIICWLTGYNQQEFESQINKQVTLETFFAEAPTMNPNRRLITGLICGIRVEEIQEPLMQEIRYMDKLIDELARGKSMDKILRKP